MSTVSSMSSKNPHSNSWIWDADHQQYKRFDNGDGRWIYQNEDAALQNETKALAQGFQATHSAAPRAQKQGPVEHEVKVPVSVGDVSAQDLEESRRSGPRIQTELEAIREAVKWGYMWAKVGDSQVRGVSPRLTLSEMFGEGTEKESAQAGEANENQDTGLRSDPELTLALDSVKGELSWILADEGLHSRLNSFPSETLVVFDDALEELSLWESASGIRERILDGKDIPLEDLLLRALRDIRSRIRELL